MNYRFSTIKRYFIIFSFILMACRNSAMLGMNAAADIKGKAESHGASSAADSKSKVEGLKLAMKYTIKGKKLDADNIKKVETIIGYEFKDKKLLVEALTAREVDAKKNYERYEYLGDTVLELVITKMLMHEYSAAKEGDLTTAGSALVRQESLAALCLRLGLHEYMQMKNYSVALPISSLCDIIESITGAIYEDGGEQASHDFVLRFFLPMIKDKLCPRNMDAIIAMAARDAKEDVEYRLVGMSCILEKKPGIGIITKALPKGKKKNVPTKEDPIRLSLYCAEQEFITKHLDKKYQQYLSCLAIDPNYKPLEKAPMLTPSWHGGNMMNFRVRLHTLTQMMRAPALDYTFQEEHALDKPRFVCTLDNHFLQPVICGAATKSEAAEAAAESAYKAIQRRCIAVKDLANESKAIAELDPKDPVASLNTLTQKLVLAVPIYTTYFKEKKGEAACYTLMSATWLIIDIKGPLKATPVEAKAAVGKRVVTLLQHFSADSIEPKKLKSLCVLSGAEKEPIQTLVKLCDCSDLERPKIETHICEGPVAEGIHFCSTISLADQHWGKKIILGQKARSKAEAERNAARQALNYMFNDMLKREIKASKS